MNTRQFNSSESPRAQRLTEEETRAVIQRWQQEQGEQGGLTDHPALPDVAEGLNISVAEAHRLLDQVRAEREREERLLAQDQTAAELEQIQLAEEQRKLAEVRRQRAELQREQAEWQRQQAEMIVPPLQQYPTQMQSAPRNDFTTAFQLIFFIALVVIAIVVMAQISSGVINPFRSAFPHTSCTLDNKPIPCNEFPIPIPQPH